MTLKRRVGALLGAASITTLSIAGCAPGSGDASNDGGQKFSLAYAVTNTEVNAYEALAKQYMSENPNVKITLNAVPNDTFGQTISTQLQAGNAPDVFQTAPGTGQGYSTIALAKAGLLAPLADQAAPLIPKGSESQFQYEGKTYGLPLSITWVGALVNKTALDKMGVGFPTDWNSQLKACDAAADGQSFYAVAGAMPPNAGVTALSIAATRVYAETPDWDAKRAAGEVTFANTKGWADTFQAILDLKNAGCFQPGVEGAGFEVALRNLVQGTSASAFGPSGATADLKKAAPDSSFSVAAFPPATSGGKAFGFASANYALSIAKESKNQDAARAFIAWMSEPKQAAAFAEAQGSLPVSGLEGADLSGTPYEPVADILKKGAFVALPNANWPNASVYDTLGVGVQALLTGQKTVDQLLDDLDAAWAK